MTLSLIRANYAVDARPLVLGLLDDLVRVHVVGIIAVIEIVLETEAEIVIVEVTDAEVAIVIAGDRVDLAADHGRPLVIATDVTAIAAEVVATRAARQAVILREICCSKYASVNDARLRQSDATTLLVQPATRVRYL